MVCDDFLTTAQRIGEIGSSFYFKPGTVAVGKEHGLDGFRFYFLGRGGVLGDVEASVAHSAFGYFEPTLFARMWDTAKQRMAPRDAARLYHRCCHDHGRAALVGVSGLEGFCAAAEQVNAGIDATGLSLYAGVKAEPLPDDAPARALHLAMVLREARGSAHLVAVIASGLSPRAAHHIRRPNDAELFGWKDIPDVTDDDRARWQSAEELTNELLWPSFAALDEPARQAYVDGAERIVAALRG